jgi:hypothetical protein
MKKLLAFEASAIVLSMAIGGVGHIFGWKATDVVNSAIIASFVAIIASAITIVAAHERIGFIAFVSAITAFTGTFATINIVGVIVGAVFAAAGAIVVSEDIKVRCVWVATSLFVEGVLVWAILYHGPNILIAMVG